MAVLDATDDATFVSQLALAGTGDSVRLVNGSTFGTLTVPNTTAAGVTIIGQDRTQHTVARLIIDTSSRIDVESVYIQMAETDFSGGQPDPLIKLNKSTIDARFRLCRIRCGYHLDSFADFDTSNAAAMYGSVIGVGSTDTWPSYNAITRYPRALDKGAGGSITGTLWFDECDFDDGSYLISFTSNGALNYHVRNCNFRRNYGDCTTLGMNENFATPNVIEFTGNMFWDCGWCQPQDKGNPHGDVFQVFSTDVGGPSDSEVPVDGVFIAGNFVGYSPNYRGQIQRVFLSDVPSMYPHLAPYIVDNVLISRITNKGIAVASGDTGSDAPLRGAAFAYVRNNLVACRPDRNTAVDNELFTGEGTPGTSAAVPSAAKISTIQDPAWPGKSFISNNIAESVEVNRTMDVLSNPNIVLGKATGGSSYSTWYDVPADWSTITTPEALYDAFVPKLAYQNYGPIRPSTTLAELRAKWSSDTKPYDELPSFVGFLDTTDLAVLDDPTTSDWSYIHAGFSTRSISVNVGTEWRTADDKDGTGAGSWSSSSGTVTHGKYLQLRRNSPSTDGGSSVASVTIGDETYTWRLFAVDNINYPLIGFTGTQLLRQVSLEGVGAAESGMMLVMWEGQFAGLPGATTDLLRLSTGTVRITLSVLSTNGRLRMAIRNNAGTSIVAGDSLTAIANGSVCRFLLAIDTSQPLALDGVKLYIDGAVDSFVPTTYTVDGLIDLDQATAFYQIGGAASTPSYVYNHGAFWLGAGDWLDIADEEVREKFRASKIGPAGEGPTGTAPRVFLVGTAAQANAGDLNKGTGVEWPKLGGTADVTAVGTDVWPPVLTISAAESPGPYTVGQPIEFFVATNGYTKSINVTSATDSTGTWDDNVQNMPLGSNGIIFTYTPTVTGTHTISFTNDGGYNNPTDIAVLVTDAAAGSVGPMKHFKFRRMLGLNPGFTI